MSIPNAKTAEISEIYSYPMAPSSAVSVEPIHIKRVRSRWVLVIEDRCPIRMKNGDMMKEKHTAICISVNHPDQNAVNEYIEEVATKYENISHKTKVFQMPCGEYKMPREAFVTTIRERVNIPCPCGNPNHWLLRILINAPEKERTKGPEPKIPEDCEKKCPSESCEECPCYRACDDGDGHIDYMCEQGYD